MVTVTLRLSISSFFFFEGLKRWSLNENVLGVENKILRRYYVVTSSSAAPSLSILQYISYRTTFDFLTVGMNLNITWEDCVLLLTKPPILTIGLWMLLLLTPLLWQENTTNFSAGPTKKLGGICEQDTFGGSNVWLLLASTNQFQFLD